MQQEVRRDYLFKLARALMSCDRLAVTQAMQFEKVGCSVAIVTRKTFVLWIKN